MRVIRYLNGKRLHGVLPPMQADGECIAALLSAVRLRQELPLPENSASAILGAEGSGLGREE